MLTVKFNKRDLMVGTKYNVRVFDWSHTRKGHTHVCVKSNYTFLVKNKKILPLHKFPPLKKIHI